MFCCPRKKHNKFLNSRSQTPQIIEHFFNISPLSTLSSINSQDFQLKIPKIFNCRVTFRCIFPSLHHPPLRKEPRFTRLITPLPAQAVQPQASAPPASSSRTNSTSSPIPPANSQSTHQTHQTASPVPSGIPRLL